MGSGSLASRCATVVSTERMHEAKHSGVQTVILPVAQLTCGLATDSQELLEQMGMKTI